MKFVSVVGVMTVSVILWGAAALPVHAGPRLAIAQERFDFGTVVQGSHPSRAIEFKNNGDEPLEIQKVQSS